MTSSFTSISFLNKLVQNNIKIHVSIFSTSDVDSVVFSSPGFLKSFDNFRGPYNKRYAVCQSPEMQIFLSFVEENSRKFYEPRKSDT